MGKSNPSKTEKNCKQTKTIPKITENEDTNIKESIIKMKVSKKNKLKIYQVLNFMHLIKINTAPIAFYNHFNEVNYSYATRFRKTLFLEIKYFKQKLNFQFRHKVQGCETVY